MGFPDNMLVDDEQVVLRLHPHWKRLVGALLATVVVVALAVLGIAVSPWPVLSYVIVGVAVLLLLIYPLRRFLGWATTHYVFTTHRILLRHGILSRSGRDIPLDRINDVSFEHNLLERLFGCGTLIIESAGEHGQIVLKDIPRVERTQATLYQLVEQDTDRDPGY
ncbi:PH domain-containing protein [Actinocatenispora rupis]|uniref:Membrane protein n=1 Tax=Actinocatenispora rupis TaxID=519421 RepID=A0A8J3JBQ3_9ACTN|nr:PH domain-containing protein [Actinocatenispora rupis]GID11868.1 membrane protein [Actinocatenispora rupis]